MAPFGFLKELISNIISRFISQYVSNYDSSKLKFDMWNGDLRLYNLKLKKGALDKFHLPVDVVEGHLGQLTIKIPWSALQSKETHVTIEDVYILAVPTGSADKVDLDEERRRAQQVKMEKLENAELLSLQPATGMSEEEERKNQTFTASLATKIIDNLVVEVKNVHIRYEDNVSVPGHPFAIGLTLSSFSAISTDENWKRSFIHDSSKGVHKLAKLDSLAVYFDTDCESLQNLPEEESVKAFKALIARAGEGEGDDGHVKELSTESVPEADEDDGSQPQPRTFSTAHQFILKPVSGEGRLILNKHMNKTTPKTDAELQFDQLGFVLDRAQYRDALSVVDLFHFYTRRREYLRFRPPHEEFDKNPARGRWNFAISAILDQVHEKHRQWSWGYFAERREDRREYIRMFKQAAKDELPDRDELDELEQKLEYRDIRLYRNLARSELRKERAKTKRTEEQEQAQPQKQGWIGWIWGGHNANTANSDRAQDTLTTDQRQELYEAIDFNEADAIASAVDAPRDAMRLRVKATLQTGSFTLRTDPKTTDAELTSLVFDALQADVVQRTDNFEAAVALGSLRVFDRISPNSLYPQIVRVKADAAPSGGQQGQSTDEAQDEIAKQSQVSDPSNPFFYAKYENKPLDDRADNALTVRMRYMEIIYHRKHVEGVFAFFKPPESQLESVSALVDAASQTLEGIRKETRAGLEFALQQHKTIDVQLDMNAPVIIIPEDVRSNRCLHVVLDAGHISVRSDLADKSKLNEVRSKEGKEYSEDDYRNLESLMYDKFHINLKAAQLVMGDSYESCMAAIAGDKPTNAVGPGSTSRAGSTGTAHEGELNELHLLERIDMSFLAENSILSKARNLTRFKVSGELPNLKVNFSDAKYKRLMRMIDVALPNFDGDVDEDGEEVDEETAKRKKREAAEKKREEQLRAIARDDESVIELDEDGEPKPKEKKEDRSASSENQDYLQKTFEFTFRVDKVSASIFKSSADPSRPEKLLANTVLEGFRFDFSLRPKDMTVNVLLRSLYVEDKMVDEKSAFKQLITSEDVLQGVVENGEKSDRAKDAESKDLVRVKYMRVQSDSPEFYEKYDGVFQSVDVDLSTINLIVTRASILILYDWIMTTFTDGGSTPQQSASPSEPGTPAEEVAPNTPPPEEQKLKVNVKLTSIVAILNDDGERIATLSLSAGDVSVLLNGPTMRVSTRLGKLSLDDDLPQPVVEQSFKKLLTIQGDELVDFRYETYDPNDPVNYPGYDSQVYVRTGSFQFTVLEDPVRRILTFFSQFARMKSLYDAATARAAAQASELQGRVQKMQYDVVVKTPILVFPRDANSRDLIVANLGEITATNTFDEENGVTKIVAGLKEVKLTSHLWYGEERNELKMISDVHLAVEIVQLQEGAVQQSGKETEDEKNRRRRPDMEIVADMTDVKMNLTQDQYRFLMALSQSVPRTFQFESSLDGETAASAPVSPPPEALIEDGPKETVDLRPELAAVAVREDGNKVPLRTTMELVFTVKTVYLELFAADAIKKSAMKEHSLAKFSLNSTELKHKMLSNGSMQADLSIKSFTVNDTRPSISTKFRELIPAIDNDGDQFMVSYTASGGIDKNAVANVTIDSPRIIFSLDPLFALLDYFMSPFQQQEGQDSTPNGTAPSADEDDQPATPAQSTLSYRVNIVEAKVILLADHEKADTEAITLSIDQIQLTQQAVMVLAVKKLGMFLCTMNKPNDAVRFLDNFDINLSMEQSINAARQVTNIDLNVEPLVFRASYRDIMLITSIVNRAIELSASSTAGRGEGKQNGDETNNQLALESKTVAPSSKQTDLSAKTPATTTVATRKTKAQVIVPRETLRATIDGFQLVLIGDMHELPMMDLKANKFVAKVNDWSGDMKAGVSIAPAINYFNLTNSAWEPLIDPWEFAIRVSRITKPHTKTSVSMTTKRLEVNVTAVFIELVLTTMAVLQREGDDVLKRTRGENAPFRMRNRSGYPIDLWAESDDRRSQTNTPVRVADGDDVPWRFDDWKSIRENVGLTSSRAMLSVQLHGPGWDRLKHVSAGREGQQIYPLRPKLDKVTHRLMVEVTLKDNVKIVTFRSPFQVENLTMIPVDVEILDSDGKRKEGVPVHNIPPGESYPLPIIAAYHNQIRVRPQEGFNYGWSDERLHWQDMVKIPARSMKCKSKSKGEAPFRFQAYCIRDTSEKLLRVYPHVSLQLRAPLEIENLLPYDIRFRLFDKNRDHNWTSFLRKGLVQPIYYADLAHLLMLSIHMQESVFGKSDFAIINTDNDDDLPVENVMRAEDQDGNVLCLRISYHKVPNSGGAFRATIYSPYVFINKTGLDFALRVKTTLASPTDAAGLSIFSKDHQRKKSAPFMFAFPKSDSSGNRALLRVGDSNWSKPLSFDGVGAEMPLELELPSQPQKLQIARKISEGLGRYKLTKVVTIYPRYLVRNLLDEPIYIREAKAMDDSKLLLGSQERKPLFYLQEKDVSKAHIRVAFESRGAQWSAPVKLNDVGRVHLKVNDPNTEEAQPRLLLRIDIVLQGPIMHVTIARETEGWPLLIRNDSSWDLAFGQALESREGDSNIRSTGLQPLKSGDVKQYAFDFPSDPLKSIKVVAGKDDRVFDMLQIGSQYPFKFNTGTTRRSAILSIDILAQGATQVLHISDYEEEDSVFRQARPASLSMSRQNSFSSRDLGFEEIKPEVITNFTFSISLEGVGISVINRRLQELLYASFRGLSLSYEDDTTATHYRLECKWIQIDNQLFGSLYPILLYPTIIPKDSKALEVHPNLQVSVAILKDQAHGVLWLKYVNVLLQEMTVEVDEDFLFALFDFSKFDGATWVEEPPSMLTDEPDEIPSPAHGAGQGDVFFEELALQPMQLDISFMRTERINAEVSDTTKSRTNPFGFILNAVTMALGNVNDAPIKLSALMLQNARLSWPVLVERMMIHYRQEFVSQIYLVLGSADFLGNPVGLFNNVASGVADIFYEPWLGAVQHGNSEIGIGIARGAGSFVKKTVFGLTDSFSKFTGSIGKGLSAATLDSDYQRGRRIRQTRNRPKHALYGFTAAGKTLLTSVTSGVEGLALRPIEGAEAEGAAGLLKGVGKGFVGAFTKPVVGVFDAASTFTEGIRNTTKVFEQNQLERVRHPRFIASDGVLRPFSEREALGQYWLRNLDGGKYFKETYVAHLDLPSARPDEVVILTTTRILLIRSIKLSSKWEVPFDDLQTISLEPGAISLILRDGHAGPYLHLPESGARLWLYKHIEKVVHAHNRAMKLSD